MAFSNLNLSTALSTCLTWYAPAFPVLYVYPWIALPRRLIHSMASTFLTGLAEIVITNPAQIGKTNICRVALHFFKDVFNSSHTPIVSLSISVSRIRKTSKCGPPGRNEMQALVSNLIVHEIQDLPDSPKGFHIMEIMWDHSRGYPQKGSRSRGLLSPSRAAHLP